MREQKGGLLIKTKLEQCAQTQRYQHACQHTCKSTMANGSFLASCSTSCSFSCMLCSYPGICYYSHKFSITDQQYVEKRGWLTLGKYVVQNHEVDHATHVWHDWATLRAGAVRIAAWRCRTCWQDAQQPTRNTPRDHHHIPAYTPTCICRFHYTIYIVCVCMSQSLDCDECARNSQHVTVTWKMWAAYSMHCMHACMHAGIHMRMCMCMCMCGCKCMPICI